MELVDLVSKPLALLLNKTMDKGCILQDWKIAYVSPMFKKGARNKAENYRPIGLTSVMCKLMEPFVKDSIKTHMRAKNLFFIKAVWSHKWKIHHDTIVILSCQVH